MVDKAIIILGLNKDFNIKDLNDAYVNKKKTYNNHKIIDECYNVLKEYFNNKGKETKKEEKSNKTKKILQKSEEELINRIRLINIMDFINAGASKEYLNLLRKILKEAPFDYFDKPDETLNTWEIYSKWKDASDYYKSVKKLK